MAQKQLTKPNLRTSQTSYYSKRTQSSCNNSIYLILLFIFLLIQEAQCSRSHLKKYNNQQQASFQMIQRASDEESPSSYLETGSQNFIGKEQLITSAFQKYQQIEDINWEFDDSHLQIDQFASISINGKTNLQTFQSSKRDRIFNNEKKQEILQRGIIKKSYISSSKVSRMLTETRENEIEQNSLESIIKNPNEQFQQIQKQQISKKILIQNTEQPQIQQINHKRKKINQNILKFRQTLSQNIISQSSQIKQKDNSVNYRKNYQQQNTQNKNNNQNQKFISVIGAQQKGIKPKIASYNPNYNVPLPLTQYQYPYPYPYPYPYSIYSYPYSYNPNPYPNPYPSQFTYINPQQIQSQTQIEPSPKNYFGNIAQGIIRGATIKATAKQQNIIIPNNVLTTVVQKKTPDGITTTSVIPFVNNQTLNTQLTNNIISAAFGSVAANDNQQQRNRFPDQKTYRTRNLSINSTDGVNKPKVLIDNVVATTITFQGQPITTIIRVIQNQNNTINGNLNVILNDIQSIKRQSNESQLPPSSNSTQLRIVSVLQNINQSRSIQILNGTQNTSENSNSSANIGPSPLNQLSLGPSPVNPNEITTIPGGLNVPQATGSGQNQAQITGSGTIIVGQTPSSNIPQVIRGGNNQTGFIQPGTSVEKIAPITKDLPIKAQRVVETKISYEDYLAKFRPDLKFGNRQEVTTYRRTIFNMNIQKIQQVNSNQKISYTYTINRYSSANIRQFNKLYANLLAPDTIKLANIIPITNYTFPEKGTQNINWTCASRLPITQGSCGSCYAISVIDAVEITFQLYNIPIRDLSINQVMACDTSNLSRKCDGGFFPSVYDYIVNKGVGFGAAYRYLQETKQNRIVPPCDQEFYQKSPYNNTRQFLQTRQRIPAADCKSLVQQLRFRAITVGIAAGGLQLYSGGRYEIKTDQPIVNEINHGVVLLGYDEELGYWYKNSWGLGWGIGGYGFMDHTAGVCLHGFYGRLRGQSSFKGPSCPKNFVK